MRTLPQTRSGSPRRRHILGIGLLVTLALVISVAVAVAAGPSPRSASGSPRPAPFGPARNGSLAYERDGDIWLADPDGSHARAIVSGPTGDGGGPTFSHDGTRIAFLRTLADGSSEVMVVSEHGTDPVVVWKGLIDWGAWAPDDASLILHTLGDTPAFTIVAADGSGSSTVDVGPVKPQGWVDFRPPDGHELIFTAYPSVDSSDVALFGIHPDGTGLRRIGSPWTTDAGTRSDGTQLPPRDTTLVFQSIAISPDGSMVSYWNWETNAEHPDLPDHYPYVRDLTSGRETVAPFGSPAVDNVVQTRFSPDGTHVLFESHTSPGSLEHLFYGPVDGDRPSHPIGPGYRYTVRQGFDLSPDGTRAFLSLQSPPRTLIIDIATGETITADQIGTLPTWQRLAP